jgi:HD-GYP domain-containing protein (c-di-GMP phosphodiesterase class II)
LHDLGKLAVPNYLLDKKTTLTDDEKARLYKHPLRTLQLLAHIPGFRRLAAVASSNSERLDGSGYHRGAKANALDLEMRILQVADVFDALTNDAPRRPAMSSDKAFVYFEKTAHDRFDQNCVAALKSSFSGSAPLPVIVESDRDVVPVRHGAMAQSAA